MQALDQQRIALYLNITQLSYELKIMLRDFESFLRCPVSHTLRNCLQQFVGL